MFSPSNTAIYHDAFLQKGGAEVVALQWSIFLGITPHALAADLSLYEDLAIDINEILPQLKSKEVLEVIYPILPLIYPFIKQSEEEFRLVSSTGIAHQIPGRWNKRVIYIHSPTRWIWDKANFDIATDIQKRLIANILRPLFKKYDSSRIQKSDTIIANSSNTAKNIFKCFGRTVPVVFPPVRDISPIQLHPKIPFQEFEYFLVIGRNRGYKNLDLAVRACTYTRSKLVVVGEGTRTIQAPNVIGLGRVPDAQLKWLYKNALALIACSNEDFGLTPVEAALYGCPTISFKHKGYLESVREGVNGQYTESNDLPGIIGTLQKFDRSKYTLADMLHFVSEFDIKSHMAKIEGYVNE